MTMTMTTDTLALTQTMEPESVTLSVSHEFGLAQVFRHMTVVDGSLWQKQGSGRREGRLRPNVSRSFETHIMTLTGQ